MIRRDPTLYGLERSRWTLAALLAQFDWLTLQSLPGMGRLLSRLNISYKQGRSHIHSPDPNYQDKKFDIAQCVEAAHKSGGKIALLYLDEVTTYRQPTLEKGYEERGQEHQPLAERSCSADTITRIVGTVDRENGRVCYKRGVKIGVKQLVEFYQQVLKSYAKAERIYIVMDNWPVHFHPDVVVALEPQETRWERKMPKNWPSRASAKAQKEWGDLQLPIQLVLLPTYASWLNPIEKLWKWLKQEVLHLHRQADKLEELRGRIDKFLDGFSAGSAKLLRYIGLAVPN